MKRWIALLLGVMMLLSLTACGKNDHSGSASKAENAGGPFWQQEPLTHVSVMSQITVLTENEDPQIQTYTPYEARWLADDLLAVYVHTTAKNGKEKGESVLLYTENGTYVGAHDYPKGQDYVDSLFGQDPALYIREDDESGHMEFMEGDDNTFSNGDHRVRERDANGTIIRDVFTSGTSRTETTFDSEGRILSTVVTLDGELFFEFQYSYTSFPVPAK